MMAIKNLVNSVSSKFPNINIVHSADYFSDSAELTAATFYFLSDVFVYSLSLLSRLQE